MNFFTFRHDESCSLQVAISDAKSYGTLVDYARRKAHEVLA